MKARNAFKCARISKISKSCKSACVMNYSNKIQYLPPTSYPGSYRVSIVTHNELRTSAPKSFDKVWVQDNIASSSFPGLSNETKNVRLTVTTFDFLGFKNSRGLHRSEERYLERFSCLKFIIRFFILLGITVMKILQFFPGLSGGFLLGQKGIYFS